MYLYYEYHKSPEGKLVLTEMRLSSHGDGRLAIAFYNLSEKTIFELAKTLLKEPPIGVRSYDDANKVWSYLGDWGAKVISRLEEVLKSLGGITLIPVEDLASQALSHRIDPSRKPKLSPEEFFYNHGAQVAQPQMSKETLVEKLAILMSVSVSVISSAEKTELKKLYRQSAMRLHPDRNNGDGSKMSELNSLWSVYNA